MEVPNVMHDPETENDVDNERKNAINSTYRNATGVDHNKNLSLTIQMSPINNRRRH